MLGSELRNTSLSSLEPRNTRQSHPKRSSRSLQRFIMNHVDRSGGVGQGWAHEGRRVNWLVIAVIIGRLILVVSPLPPPPPHQALGRLSRLNLPSEVVVGERAASDRRSAGDNRTAAPLRVRMHQPSSSISFVMKVCMQSRGRCRVNAADPLAQ
jgi:hypothetical protein